MVEHRDPLNAVFGALADPTRRSMLDALRHGERTVSQLAEPFEMSLAGASKHLQVLEKARLITRRKEGRTYFCAVNEATLHAAQQWLETWAELWNRRLDTLESLLQQEQADDD